MFPRHRKWAIIGERDLIGNESFGGKPRNEHS